MCRPHYWLWGLIPLALLAAIAYSLTTPELESRLALAASAALAEAGEPWARITVTGRDVTLHGTAPSQENLDDALAAAASADGVRRVRHDVVVRVAPAN